MRRRTVGRAAVAVALAGAGLLLATSATTARGTDLRGSRESLTDLLTARQADLAALTATEERLQAQVRAATDAAAAAQGPIADANARADALTAGVGLTPVTGDGLRVALDDAPTNGSRTVLSGVPAPTADDLVVHQQDVQSVVNGLWAGGATAMTVMGVRVTTTTAVRCVGNTLLLAGAVYSPPFVVEAVGGDPVAMRSALEAESGVKEFRRYVDAYGLGYDVQVVRGQTLPAADAPALTHASPVVAGATTSRQGG